MGKVTISFTLDDALDRDLLTQLEAAPKGERSQKIRDALRAHLGMGGVTLGEIYALLRSLDRRIQGEVILGTVARARASSGESDEPPEAAEALDDLGK